MAKKKRKVVRQVKDINKRVRDTFKNVAENQEKVITQALIVIQGTASYYTPQDTNALINSQYRQVRKEGGNTKGRVGYTQGYALALHSPTPGSALDGWEPKPPGTPGKKRGGYNPNAKQGFLVLAVEEEKDTIRDIIINGNKL